MIISTVVDAAGKNGKHFRFESGNEAIRQRRALDRRGGFQRRMRLLINAWVCHGLKFRLRKSVMTWHGLFMPKASPIRWTRAHLLIARNLYGKIEFGKLHRRNPIIVEIAGKLGRSPSGLAMKLVNFASFDPVLQSRNIRGLPNASRQDRAIWDEFDASAGALEEESEQLLHDLFTNNDMEDLDFLGRDKIRLEASPGIPTGATETTATVRNRRGQQYFRQSIIIAYGVRCCITDVNVPALLVATPIKPWNKFPEERLKPSNGLCLSKIHDAAFALGLITLDEDLRVVLGTGLKDCVPQSYLEQSFVPFEGKKIQLPEKLAKPDAAFLDYHREKVFGKRMAA